MDVAELPASILVRSYAQAIAPAKLGEKMLNEA
jgi:hypothetical protein